MGRTRVEVCRGEWQDVMCCVDEEKKSCWVGMGSYLWKLRSWGGGRCSLTRKARSLQPGNRGNRGLRAARRCQFPASFPIGTHRRCCGFGWSVAGPRCNVYKSTNARSLPIEVASVVFVAFMPTEFSAPSEQPVLGMTHDATDSRGHKACWPSPLPGVAYVQGVVVYMQ